MSDQHKILTSGTLLNALATNTNTETPTQTRSIYRGRQMQRSQNQCFSFGVTSNTKMFDAPARASTPMNITSEQPQTATVPTTSAPCLVHCSICLRLARRRRRYSSSLVYLTSQCQHHCSKIVRRLITPQHHHQCLVLAIMHRLTRPPPPAALTLLSAPEKPQFPFTFGSNPAPTTDSGALFKSPFGAPESSNVQNQRLQSAYRILIRFQQ